MFDHNEFKDQCRWWRQQRKMSQLDLALAADISQRHVSYLETGRSLPSRLMVMRLADALLIPKREHNRLLHAAGYATSFSESALSDPMMQPVLDTLNTILAHHDPLPALVVDRYWNIKLQNWATQTLLKLLLTDSAHYPDFLYQGEINLALLTLHPFGLRQFVQNWTTIAPTILRRINLEMTALPDNKLKQLLSALIVDLEQQLSPQIESTALLPIVPLTLQINERRINLFSVIATFGTALDITADELRIESFYAQDQQTVDFFQHLSTIAI
jgi:transcriptional regulator with XRE-family HTH domain